MTGGVTGLNTVKFKNLVELLIVSTKLGLTSFGGPIAHLGYFHEEYIRRRKWIDERSYAELVALCHFLPGPASSQVGMGIGIIRSGLLGGVTAWIGFTLPSVIALVLFAFVMREFDISSEGWIHGLKIAAVAIVAQAVLGMGQKLAFDRSRAAIAVLAASVVIMWQNVLSQVGIIALAGAAGLFLYKKTTKQEESTLSVPISRGTAAICLLLFLGLLLALPILTQMVNADWLYLIDSFYRVGSLVFGGGHVVLPLLESEVVSSGWINDADFLAGYGAAQAVPGPLFTFAGYVGAIIGGINGAVIATAAIFLPAFLLIAGVLPFWSAVRMNASVQGALVGINAAVVGLLLAALYDPLWSTTILSSSDFVLVSILFLMLQFWKLPPWAVVITAAVGGIVIQ